MMTSETVVFCNPQGLISEYITQGYLDIAAFETGWLENAVLQKLEALARQHLAIEDLSNHPELSTVLLEAYRLGNS